MEGGLTMRSKGVKVAGLALLAALFSLAAVALLASSAPALQPTELAETNHGEKQIDKEHLQEDDTDQKKFENAVDAAESAYNGGQWKAAKAQLALAKDALDSVDSDDFPHDGKQIKREMGDTLKDLEARINSGEKQNQMSLRAEEEKPARHSSRHSAKVLSF